MLSQGKKEEKEKGLRNLLNRGLMVKYTNNAIFNYLINVEVLSSHRVKGELEGDLDFVLTPFAIPGHPPDIFDHLFVKLQAGHVARPLDADEFRPVKNNKIS